MKIAIIDPDESARDLTIKVLQDLGFKTFESFEKFQDFNRVLGQVKFDLVITDYLLDEGKTAKDILEDARLSSATKFIVRTTYFDQGIYNALRTIRPIIFLNKRNAEANLDLKQSLEFLNHSELKIALKKRKITSSFYIKIGDRHRQIVLDEVFYFEVDGKYLNVVCKDKKYVMRSGLSELQRRLRGRFVRVHSAYLVNVDKIDSFKLSENIIELNGISLPLSRKYKPEFLESIIVT